MIKLMKDFSKSRPDQMISYIMQAEKKVFKRKATAFSKKKKTSVNSKEEGKPKAFVPSKARPNTPIARSYWETFTFYTHIQMHIYIYYSYILLKISPLASPGLDNVNI